MRPAWRSDATFLAAFVLFSIAVVAVDVFTVLHDRAEAGRPVALWEPAVWEISSVLMLTALAPAVMAFARRFPPSPPPRLGWLGWHILLGLGFSLVHVLGMGVLRWAAYSAADAWYDPLGPIGDWPYELRKDALVYGGVVICYVLWRSSASIPRYAPVGVPPIEVRDGARRVFVPVEDILWVEAAGNYVELHAGGDPILHRASLTEMERRLAGADFVRIHRSRLVRRAAITAVEAKPSGDFVVRLTGGETLAGSRRFRSSTRA